MTLQQKQISLSLFFSICTILFQSCSKTYSPKPFAKPFCQGVTQDKVTVFTHELSGYESEHYFNLNLTEQCNAAVSSARPGYQIIHLTIENKSQDFYFLATKYLNVTLVPVQEINDHVRAANVATIVHSEGAIYNGYARQERIWQDLCRKMLHTEETPIISPYNKLDKLLFIEKNKAVKKLSVPLINYHTGNTKTFTIDLHSRN